LSGAEARSLDAALATVADEMSSGAFAFRADDEDIHTAVERRVTELAGATGAKLHTGRSRNDQVATDLRLWARGATAGTVGALLSLAATLHRLGDAVGDAYLPGYTHMQRAQPVLLSHHLRAHAWALTRDAERFLDAAHRTEVSPLGAGALAGTSLPIDPLVAAARLGFPRTFENSLDAVSDRDFVAELLFCAALAGVHCSRMGEELVLWSTSEFSFCVLDDRYATGSSMLPQKKNPDVAELARGKAGRLLGNLTGLLATLKGLPLSYNRDLQEDKEPLFDSFAQLQAGLAALEGCYSTLRFDTAKMATAADDPNAAAVDLAEWLVARGMPFREAHHVVGTLVATSISDGIALSTLVADAPDLGEEAAALLSPGTAVARRTSPGGAGPVAAGPQRAALEATLAMLAGRLDELPRILSER